ncbi:hypothetical protein E4S40_14420 [Algoriphagus kandeliae]|uniref:DUF3551 domain-containing protein n=1 Tax=Algoriphagus kandeliae TaxID=2562278 RepID=A0A4Y9QPD2_9BACT|nr:hypothetical protein [Algoriphagus kandeliae]TFV93442.1 hypothetical protein E4S40_14420 [Algoriphagus kandeliae]
MKKLIKKLVASSLLILFLGAMASTSMAQNNVKLCSWSEEVQFCLMSAPDGYCAYGGADCSTTYPVVEESGL